VKGGSIYTCKSVVNFINILRAAFAQYSCVKKLQSQTVTGEKLRKTLWYKKGVHEMLMKLTSEPLFFGFVKQG